MKMRHKPYEVGDLVWLNDPTESRRKLAPHWKGPYLVRKQLDLGDDVGVTYQISIPFGDEPPLQTIHYDRLRPYNLPEVSVGEGAPKTPFTYPHLLCCKEIWPTP